jgi:hypothetical protein
MVLCQFGEKDRKESQMSHPDPRYLGDEGEISARYRAGSFSRIPLAPHQMQERFTLTQDIFVLCHLGVPQIEADSWSLPYSAAPQPR